MNCIYPLIERHNLEAYLWLNPGSLSWYAVKGRIFCRFRDVQTFQDYTAQCKAAA